MGVGVGAGADAGAGGCAGAGAQVEVGAAADADPGMGASEVAEAGKRTVTKGPEWRMPEVRKCRKFMRQRLEKGYCNAADYHTKRNNQRVDRVVVP